MKHYVRFHIGRAGRAGQLYFVNEDNFNDLLRQVDDGKIFIRDQEYDPETDEYTDLPDDQCCLVDVNGNILVEGCDAMSALTGRLAWDGEYNTDYVTTTDDLSQKEIECLRAAYFNDAYMSDELKNIIHNL